LFAVERERASIGDMDGSRGALTVAVRGVVALAGTGVAALASDAAGLAMISAAACGVARATLGAVTARTSCER
jgi:hypothetical protein